MKKDKAWLKGLINEEGIVMDMHLLGRHDEQYWKNENIKINKGRLFCLIDQLDEPEVLSQEWIDENKVARIDNLRKMTTSDVVPVEKLKNLIVPKQEEVTEKPVEAVKGYFKSVEKAKEVLEELGHVVSEKPTKPVIPQFVADYIEKWKHEGLSMSEWLAFDHDNDDDENKVERWIYDNDYETNRRREFTLIDAIRYGYEVEKEKKYRVTFNLTEWNDEASELEENSVFLALDVTSDETLIITSRDGIGDYRTDLTEPQIKAIDERYWAFAVEVTQ